MVKVGSTQAEIGAVRELLDGKAFFSFDGMERFERCGDVLEDGSGTVIRTAREVYEGSSAVEWTMWITQNGNCNSGRIASLLPLDVTVDGGERVLVSYPSGTAATIEDFALREDELDGVLRYESVGSRQITPFFNVDLGGRGYLVAVGWTRNWFFEVSRTDGGIALRAGMPKTDFYLRPGEHVRTPRIMLMYWEGAKTRSYNLLRRHLIANHIPKDRSGEPYPPICLNSWGSMKTENHLRLIDYVKSHGLKYDAYWIDAGWFGDDHDTVEYQRLGDDDWFYHQGNWRVNRTIHPDTLKPISDAAHEAGMKLLLWYDMYNCIDGVGWTKDHPEWGHLEGPMGKNDTHEAVMVSMLNVNDPDARKWMIDTLIASMEENGVDYYREDPPPIYGGEDEEDRVGVCEMKAVEALYEIWDSLLERFPEMVIDNCGGGGSRVDLESIGRTYVLWRSDYNCHPGADPIGSQVGNMGLGHFVPLVSCAPPTKPGDDYTFRSGLYGCMGFGLFHCCAYENGMTYPAPDYPIEWHREKLVEYREVKPYFSGDFYALRNSGTDETDWFAYEMYRSDMDEGVVLAFRRPKCEKGAVKLCPRMGDGEYILVNRDTGEEIICRDGDEIEVKAEQPSSAVMLIIKKK